MRDADLSYLSPSLVEKEAAEAAHRFWTSRKEKAAPGCFPQLRRCSQFRMPAAQHPKPHSCMEQFTICLVGPQCANSSHLQPFSVLWHQNQEAFLHGARIDAEVTVTAHYSSTASPPSALRGGEQGRAGGGTRFHRTWEQQDGTWPLQAVGMQCKVGAPCLAQWGVGIWS